MVMAEDIMLIVQISKLSLMRQISTTVELMLYLRFLDSIWSPFQCLASFLT